MHILALTEEPNHVCYRYRVEAFASALTHRGHSLESLPLVLDTFRRTRQLREARSVDLVILQRKLLPLWQLRLLRRHARRLIYDFDDAMFCRDSYSPKGPKSWSRLAHFWATIYAADAVVAGNDYLRKTAAEFVEPEKVIALPTCVEPAAYAPAVHGRRGAAIRLAWIGQRSTLGSLDAAARGLELTAQQLPGITLRLICDTSPTLAGVRVEPRPWSVATEASELSQVDVGISWLPDDPWSLGKCGLKVLQYMAAGLPVVANSVGIHRQLIQDGVTGILADSPAEWMRAIGRLAADPTLRARMGAAGRRAVENHYSVGRWAGTFVRLLESTARPSAVDGQAPAMSPLACGPMSFEQGACR